MKPARRRTAGGVAIAGIVLWLAPLSLARADDPKWLRGPTEAPSAEARLSLDRAMALARAAAQQTQLAEQNLRLAGVEQRRAWAAILPRLSLGMQVRQDGQIDRIFEQRVLRTIHTEPELLGEFSPFVDTPIVSSYDPDVWARLDLRQTLFDGGRSWVNVARASDLEDIRKLSRRWIDLSLRRTVAHRFYGLLRAEAFEAQVRDRIEVTRAQYERRQKSGTLRPRDLAAAQRNIAQDRVLLARRVYSVSQARRSLNLAMGQEADRHFVLAVPRAVRTASVASAAVGGPLSVSSLTEAALSGRPDLRQRLLDLRRRERLIQYHYGYLWPDLTAGASYIRRSRRPDRVFSDPTQNFDVAADVTLRWNLFDGGRRYADLEAARIEVKKAKIQIAEHRRQIRGQVQNAVEYLELQKRVLGLAQQALQAADETVRLTRKRDRNGGATVLEVRDAELRFSDAYLAAYSARIDVEIARVNLAWALGRDDLKLASSRGAARASG